MSTDQLTVMVVAAMTEHQRLQDELSSLPALPDPADTLDPDEYVARVWARFERDSQAAWLTREIALAGLHLLSVQRQAVEVAP